MSVISWIYFVFQYHGHWPIVLSMVGDTMSSDDVDIILISSLAGTQFKWLTIATGLHRLRAAYVLSCSLDLAKIYTVMLTR